MKKFVTTLLLTAVTAASVFAFTACGGNDNEKETEKDIHAVTETEWKAALNLITEGKTSLKVKHSEYGEYGSSGSVEFEYDYANKTASFDGSYTDWGDGSSEEVKEEVAEQYSYFSGSVFITELSGYDMREKYGEYTYDEEEKAYVATFAFQDTSEVLNLKYSLYFENGKLIKLGAGQTGEYYTFEYTYGITVIIPESKETVTAEEWQSALKSIYDCKQSVECISKFTSDNEVNGSVYHYWFDSANKSIRLNIDDTVAVYDIYLWEDGGKYYEYDGDETGELSKEEYEEEMQMLAISYTGNGLIFALAENKTFSTSAYDKADKTYKGTSEQYDDKFNYTLKFENKKLVKLVAELLNADNETVNMTITVEYKYGNISVTIPE